MKQTKDMHDHQRMAPYCLYSPKGYLRTDISGIDQASSFHITHILLSFTVISLTPIFILFDW